MADMKLKGWTSGTADIEISYDRRVANLLLTGFEIPPHLEEELREDEALRMEFFRLELVRLAEEIQESQSCLSEAHG